MAMHTAFSQQADAVLTHEGNFPSVTGSGTDASSSTLGGSCGSGGATTFEKLNIAFSSNKLSAML